MGTSTDSAIEASDLTLLRGGLLAVADALRLSRRTLRTIKGSLFWASPATWQPSSRCARLPQPAHLSGAAMAFSSVFVVPDSLRPRRFQPGSERAAQHERAASAGRAGMNETPRATPRRLGMKAQG